MTLTTRLRRHICFLDVGHGNSTVIVADDDVVIIDAGSQSALSEFLREQDITHVDSIYLSHADADHVGGVLGLVATQKVTIGRILLNSDASQRSQVWSDLWYELDLAQEEAGVEVIVGLTAGRQEELSGGVCLDVLAPSTYLVGRSPGSTVHSGMTVRSNSISAVISVTVGDLRIALLTGDLDAVGLVDLRDRGIDLCARILIYPHHGGHPGAGMDPQDFVTTLLAAVEPEAVIFSIGRSQYNTPTPETVRILRERLPNVRIVCTQLSRHCSTTRPTESSEHLSACFARGRHSQKCCGGTVVVPLDDFAALLPRAAAHARFIREHADSALCGAHLGDLSRMK